MCNCGKKRAALNKQNLSNSANDLATINATELTNSKFEYTGQSSLTIIGSSTGSRYHFRWQGDIQEVKHGDVMFMMGVPVLRKVK